MAKPWDELVMHAKACHDAMGGAVVSLTATPYKVHINNVGAYPGFEFKTRPQDLTMERTQGMIVDLIRAIYPPQEEQQAADPYANI